MSEPANGAALHESDVLARARNSAKLPTVPAVATRVLSLCRNPDVDFAELAELATADASIVARLLQLANSALFASRTRVTSVHAALARLGLKVTRIAVLGFALEADVANKVPVGFDIGGFWRQALTTATAARLLAKQISPARRDDAFSAGLLQDVGIVAFQCTIPNEYAPVTEALKQEPTSDIGDVERRILGATHAEFGSQLLAEWGLPESLCEPVAYHRCPADAEAAGLSADVVEMAWFLLFGSAVGRLFQDAGKGVHHKAVMDLATDRFGLSVERTEALLTQVESGVRQTCDLFRLDPNATPAYAEVRVQAVQEVAKLAIEVGQTAHQLREEADELKELASHDELTGLLNRREFEKRAEAELSRARRSGHGVGIVLLDIDHFKAVNDTLGHQAGDEALRRFGVFMREQLRGWDLVARYGGEEFICLLPESDVDAALVVAEKLRLGIANASVAWVKRLGGITVSVGVAQAGSDSPLFDMPSLIEQADKCLYQAKADGRNCTRYTTV